MEDLAASLIPHSHSAPLYLLYDLSAVFPGKHGLAPPPVPLHDDGFEFATTARSDAGGAAALRACASDVSAAAFADELLRAGALLPLSLPPRLQRPACYSAGASATTSPTHHAGGRKHRGFDPFAAALEKVRQDGAEPRRARSLSPLRAAAAGAPSSARTKSGSCSRPAPAAAAQKKAAAAVGARRARRGVRHLLCRAVVMTGAAMAPKALWPRRKDGVSYRPGLLVCLGYGV